MKYFHVQKTPHTVIRTLEYKIIHLSSSLLAFIYYGCILGYSINKTCNPELL